ncbi:MAG TPA: hypothetical protein VGG75_34380 [Trebonia sp.]|jgi:hypothetical protein
MRHPVSRRSALTALGTLGLAAVAGCTSGSASSAQPATARSSTPSASGSGGTPRTARNALGANINSDVGTSDLADMAAVSAPWLRAFYPMADADQPNVAGQPIISEMLEAKAKGHGTVLSLMFPYASQPIPAPGSTAMATAQRRLNTVLQAVMGTVDILVVGNEPFIECRAQDRDSTAINVFYETLAKSVISYRSQRGATSTSLYMGALNHLDEPAWRTAATERWMSFVRATPELDGTDMHPHLSSPAAGEDYINYVVPRLRADQTFLATEFSLVLLFKAHLSDPASSQFTSRYGLPADTKVWQVLGDAFKSPFPQQKWNDFLTMSPWFASHSEFLHNQVTKFRATGRLAVACYGLSQGKSMAAHPFGPQSTPWILNSLFCPYTVQQQANGQPGETTVWVNEFRALQ